MTSGAYQKTRSAPVQTAANGFVTKVGPSGSLLYSTYIGGESSDVIWSLALDAQNNIIAAGQTSSQRLQMVNAFQPTRAGPNDGWIAKLNPSFSGAAGLLYSTYLGGAGQSSILSGVAADKHGNIYVGGGTYSADYPVTAATAFLPTLSSAPAQQDPNTFGLFRDGVVTELNPSSSGAAQLVYSTFLGGSGYNQIFAVALDGQGKLVLAGATDSADFPV